MSIYEHLRRLKKAWEDNEFLQQVNKSLTENQEQWKKKLAQTETPTQKDAKIKDLEEQVRERSERLVYVHDGTERCEGQGP